MVDWKPQTRSARRIRLGIVGCGEVTRAKHLPAIRTAKGVEIAVAADLEQSRCREVAAEFAIPCTCSTIEELLQTPDLDAVAVCTPPATHADLAIAALRAGKHVWVDKPLALSEGECVRMMDEAARAGTVTMTGFHMRFHRLLVKARAVIQGGELGRIESVRVVWHSPRSDLNIPAWKTIRATGGGALVEIAPHHLDLLRFLLGAEIAEIFAISNDDVREDENAVINARMSSGVLVSGEFSERSPHEIEFVISGSAGNLTVDCLRFEGFHIRAIRQVPGAPGYRAREGWNFLRSLPAGLGIVRRGGDYRISYSNAWSAFFDAIRGRPVSLPSFADGLRATQAVSAALDARERRALVMLPPPRTAPDVPIGSDAATALTDAGKLVFSVVVPTFNRPAQLKQLLDALVLQRFPPSDFEVIVVDDGGREPLEPIIAPWRDRLQIRLLHQANSGCAAARQAGIEAAVGQFLALTDDDCLPGRQWLASLHAALLRDPASAVVGPTLNELATNPRSETTQLIVNWLIRADTDPDGRVRYGPTSNFGCRADHFARVGGLDKSWRIAGGEDRDLCARWLEAGLGIRFAPQAQVTHRHPLTAGQFVRQHFHYGRGAREFRRRFRADQIRYRGHGSLGDYFRLMLLPWKNYDGRVAATIAMHLVLAQAATAAGIVAEMCGLCRPRATSSDWPGAFTLEAGTR
jgi:predicted dehydrogenase/GT2 family glycosyltransferase